MDTICVVGVRVTARDVFKLRFVTLFLLSPKYGID